MNRYPLINFSRFTPIEICDFITDRVHPDINNLLRLISEAVLGGQSELSAMDEDFLLPIQLMQLKEKCETLLRLEKLVLFPHIRQQYAEAHYVDVSDESVQHLNKLQNSIFVMLTQLKLSINYYVPRKKLNFHDTLMMNDLYSLELLINDWIYMVQCQLLSKLKYPQLSVSDNNSLN